MDKFRILGPLRIGQAIINALQDAGHIRQKGLEPQLIELPNGQKKVVTTVLAYEVIGRDLFYMEDAELIKLVRDYIVRLERQDVERKTRQEIRQVKKVYLHERELESRLGPDFFAHVLELLETDQGDHAKSL